MNLIKQNSEIILASTSPVRKEIMTESGLDFKAISPDFDEDIAKVENPDLSIEELALFLARGKALSISKKFPDAVVIGSDQICEIDGKKIDKSKDEQDAISQLKLMNGKTHFQNNGVAIFKNSELIFQKITRVELEMRAVSEGQILSYVNADKPFGCAGSYKYEGLGKHLFANIKGDYYSILGLNIQEVLSFLHEKKYIEI